MQEVEKVYISTTDQIYGHEIIDHVGVVMDEVHFYEVMCTSKLDRTTMVGKGRFNIIRDDHIDEFLSKREEALCNLKAKALELGANGVVGIRFEFLKGDSRSVGDDGKPDYSFTPSPRYAIFASGTAVKVK